MKLWTSNFSAIVGAVVALAVTAPALAQTVDNPTVLNAPGVNAWSVYGAGQVNKLYKDPAVQGGGAMRITIAQPTENAWDIGMSTPVDKAFKKGETIMLAVWAKVESDDADTLVKIPAAIQINTSPYTGIIQGRITLTTQWQLLHIEGVSNDDYAAGKTNVALSLGGSAKKIDIGPAFVLDEGILP